MNFRRKSRSRLKILASFKVGSSSRSWSNLDHSEADLRDDKTVPVLLAIKHKYEDVSDQFQTKNIQRHR